MILSPTEITRAKWPGAQLVPAVALSVSPDPRIPKINDKAIIQGKNRNFTFVKPNLVGGELVRIEMTVAG